MNRCDPPLIAPFKGEPPDGVTHFVPRFRRLAADTNASRREHIGNLDVVWAKQEYMADRLAGKGIVYSRKPDPNLLGVDVTLNEEAWAAEISTTLGITANRNIPLEFVVRDVYTMHGNLDKARRAVEIARREIDRRFGPVRW